MVRAWQAVAKKRQKANGLLNPAEGTRDSKASPERVTRHCRGARGFKVH